MKETEKKEDLLVLLKNESLLHTNAVADKLKVSRSTIYRLIEEGKLRAIRLSERNMRVLESSLREYLRSINRDFF